MAHHYELSSDHPQPRLITQIVEQLRQGAVMLYPTDTVYAIGCDVTQKTAVERVRSIKRLSNDKPLTFLCTSLSQTSTYAQLSDPIYRLMRRLTPGPYTFLLPATKWVPKLVRDPKRKTAGIRIPAHPLCQALLQQLDQPLISTSAKIEGEVLGPYALTPQEFEPLEKQVDLVLFTDAPLVAQVSTVLDMTTGSPKLVRAGLGYEQVAQVLDLD